MKEDHTPYTGSTRTVRNVWGGTGPNGGAGSGSLAHTRRIGGPGAASRPAAAPAFPANPARSGLRHVPGARAGGLTASGGRRRGHAGGPLPTAPRRGGWAGAGAACALPAYRPRWISKWSTRCPVSASALTFSRGRDPVSTSTARNE
ncbi:hypothetical protein Slala03_40550 [Streptomyces lavendulae subsp. lavendulae]|nr:hypothetical protein Slala03_40550 [Streptomyces lavendulae subsp. lavendulae]